MAQMSVGMMKNQTSTYLIIDIGSKERPWTVQLKSIATVDAHRRFSPAVGVPYYINTIISKTN